MVHLVYSECNTVHVIRNTYNHTPPQKRMSAVRPQPPPKPQGFPPFAPFPLKTGDAAPTDSDTDSGICADSDQSSPRQPSPRNNGRRDGDYLTPNSARRLLEHPRRTLPPRPTPNSTLRKAQFRVRFADEVDSGASTSSSSDSPRVETTFSSPSSKPLTLINNSAYAHIENRRYDSLPRAPRRSNFSVDDVETLPDPPSYAIAVQRIRSIPQRESVRDSVIRHNVESTMRNRSSSLPRGSRGTDLSSFYSEASNFGNEQLLGSVDNLNYGNYEDSTLRRRRLPPSPLHRPDLEMHEREAVRQPALMRQRRCRVPAPSLSRRSASLGRHPDSYLDSLEYNYESEPAVRAQLIALDQRGFRTVLVEKTQPGPFGFYIATGVMHGQRGIFISRVSLPSLTPMLSVGDEILYVDDELVKGRSLEYVQSLISGKTAVAIVLLPTVGALC